MLPLLGPWYIGGGDMPCVVMVGGGRWVRKSLVRATAESNTAEQAERECGDGKFEEKRRAEGKCRLDAQHWKGNSKQGS